MKLNSSSIYIISKLIFFIWNRLHGEFVEVQRNTHWNMPRRLGLMKKWGIVLTGWGGGGGVKLPFGGVFTRF